MDISKSSQKLGQITQRFHPLDPAALLIKDLESEADYVVLTLQAVLPIVVQLLRIVYTSLNFCIKSEEVTDTLVDDNGQFVNVRSRVDITLSRYGRRSPVKQMVNRKVSRTEIGYLFYYWRRNLLGPYKKKTGLHPIRTKIRHGAPFHPTSKHTRTRQERINCCASTEEV